MYLTDAQDRIKHFSFATFLVGWLSYPYLVINISGYSLTALHVFVLLTLVSLRRIDRTVFIACLGIIASFLFASVVGIFFYTTITKFLTHGLQTLFCVLTIIFFTRYDLSNAVAQKLLCITVLIVLAYLVYQLAGRFQGWDYTFLKIRNLQLSSDGNSSGFQRGYHLLGTRILELRPNSFFIEPGTLGYFCAGMALLIIKPTYKIVALIGLLFSMSLGAYFIYSFTLLCKLLIEKRFFRLSVIILISIILFAALHNFSDMFRLNISERILRVFWDGGFSGEKRFRHIEVFYDFFTNSPVYGYGLYGEKIVLGDTALSMVYQMLLVERGIIGLVLYMSPIVFLGFYQTSKYQKVIAIFYFTSLLWKPYKFFLPGFMFVGYMLSKRKRYK